MNAAIELPDTVLDEIAQRAVDLLAADSQQPPEPWLSVEQAAAHMSISVSQFYTLCSQRQHNGIPVTKEGSRTYAKASQLDAWRASR